MKKITKKLNKKGITVIMTLIFLITNSLTLMAQDRKEHMIDEISEQKEAGSEVYKLVDENGNIAGYYEPYPDIHPEPIIPRYTANINWTIPPAKAMFGLNEFTLGEGSKFHVRISQSRTGSSFIRL